MRVIRDRPRTFVLDEFLARPLFAHLATASEHGPRVSPVWFIWEDDAVWIIGDRGRTTTFPSRLERDPRCAVAIVDFDLSTGLVQHLGLRGRATVEPFDPERARRILARYLGDRIDSWDPRFQEWFRQASAVANGDDVLVRFTPETAVARDVSYRGST